VVRRSAKIGPRLTLGGRDSALPWGEEGPSRQWRGVSPTQGALPGTPGVGCVVPTHRSHGNRKSVRGDHAPYGQTPISLTFRRHIQNLWKTYTKTTLALAFSRKWLTVGTSVHPTSPLGKFRALHYTSNQT